MLVDDIESFGHESSEMRNGEEQNFRTPGAWSANLSTKRDSAKAGRPFWRATILNMEIEAGPVARRPYVAPLCATTGLGLGENRPG